MSIEHFQPVWDRIEQLAYLAAGLRREHDPRCGQSKNIICRRCEAIAEYDVHQAENRRKAEAYRAEQRGRAESFLKHPASGVEAVTDAILGPDAHRFKTGETYDPER